MLVEGRLVHQAEWFSKSVIRFFFSLLSTEIARSYGKQQVHHCICQDSDVRLVLSLASVGRFRHLALKKISPL